VLSCARAFSVGTILFASHLVGTSLPTLQDVLFARSIVDKPPSYQLPQSQVPETSRAINGDMPSESRFSQGSNRCRRFLCPCRDFDETLLLRSLRARTVRTATRLYPMASQGFYR
jgi:hypothetical protein